MLFSTGVKHFITHGKAKIEEENEEGDELGGLFPRTRKPSQPQLDEGQGFTETLPTNSKP